MEVMMHRCATGEHRGEGLGEGLAEVTAIAAAIVSDKEPGWESLQAVVRSARAVWPHVCVAPWGANAVRNTWGPCVGDESREACQVWAINQSLETLTRQMFRATAYMCPHRCSDLGQFL